MQRLLRIWVPALLAAAAHAADPDAVVHVSLTAPGYTSANAPEMPRVKFNKAAPLCMISDDMSLSDFCSTWALFNGYPHPETTKDRQYPRGDVFLDQAVRDLPAGYYDGDADGDGAPDGVHEPLTFSDGAGLRRRFACSSAVLLQSDGNYLQISPADVRTMSRTGWSATYHDVDQCDVNDAASIAARFAPLSARWEALTGHAPKIMTEPNGNHTYLDACRISPEICWSLFQNAAAGYPANSMRIADWTDRAAGIPSSFESKPQGSFYRIWAQGYEYNFSNAVNKVINSGAGTEIIVGGTHGVQSWFKTYFLREIQESDLFWVASVDEIWEYYWLWHHVSFENLAYDPATQRLAFDVRIPAPAKHQFRDITVNLPGLAGASDWSVEGAVTANAAQGENGFTMNLGVEDHVLRDADELLDLREQHVDNPCIARDAQYLVSLLAPGPGKDVRQARLDRQLKYSWSVRSQQNDLFTAGACNEPTNFAYAVPLFVLHGTDLYRLEPNDYGRYPLCGGTVALDDAHPAFATNWTYTVREAHGKGVEGCAFYAEGEDLFPAAPGLFDVAGLSLRAAGQPAGAGAVPLGRLSPGVYKFGFQYYRPSGAGKSTWTVLTNGAPAVVHANNKNDARSDVMTAEFTLARGADVALAVTPNSGASGDLVDAVWFKKTGEVAVIAPELGAVEADTSARGAVTLRVPVVSLGPEAESATLSVTLGGSTQTREIAAPGTFEFLFEGLDPATAYAWTATAANDLGASETSSGSATTRPLPVSLSAPAALVDEERSVAALSVSVALDAPSATLSLRLDGAPAGTFALSASGVFSTNVSVRAGAEHSFLFTAVADGTTATAGGTFAAYLVTDWFRVRWGADGYPEGPGWDASAAAQARSGGAWSRPAPADASALAEGRLALASTNAATALVFAPTNASPAGVDLVVEGVATPVAGARPAPEGEPLAGLAFAEEGLLVWTDGAWRKASGASWRSGETAWRAELDFAADAPARVRYSVGGAVATVDGEEWLPVARAATGAERVVLLGRGSLGDFRGVLRALVADPVEIPAPVFAEGGAALAFPDAATFSLTLSGTDAGFWYTAFAADAVEGPYVAEADSVRGTGGALVLTLDADAAEHPARFVRVAVSREPCAAGVSLESFLAQ